MTLAGSVLPPILAAYVPPVLSERRRALERGAWLPTAARPADAAPLRGALALLLRSVACAEPERNYCSLATATEPAAVERWRCQSRRLLLCCAALLGGPPEPQADLLLQAAAARTIAVLLDELQWRCYPAGARAEAFGRARAPCRVSCRDLRRNVEGSVSRTRWSLCNSTQHASVCQTACKRSEVLHSCASAYAGMSVDR